MVAPGILPLKVLLPHKIPRKLHLHTPNLANQPYHPSSRFRLFHQSGIVDPTISCLLYRYSHCHPETPLALACLGSMVSSGSNSGR